MDMEVVGRHALLFDDDATAELVNSGDALVEWHSLRIDRYDVRHLLSAPPPPRRRNRTSERILLEDASLESQLDHERYLDLPSHSDQPDVEEDKCQSGTPGYHAVTFSYGNTDDSTEQKNTDAGMVSSRFLPRFPIPGNLVDCLPPTEKVHEIIARTAMFVSKHGGQSEIILRVRQGNNPTFGFLMPDHHLHAYFRFLVDHPELLSSESDGNTQDDRKRAGSDHNISNGFGGALSLLGSVYGSGEEEEGDSAKTENIVSQDCATSVNCCVSQVSGKIQLKGDEMKDDSESRKPILSNKEKVLTVRKNSLITASKFGTVKDTKEKSCSFSAAVDKAKSLTVGMTSKIAPVILEPPTELKRLIDKLVEFIIRNGKEFEVTLIEQDREHGRFPFLLPSNQYHSYYLKVLETAQESKVNGKSSYSGVNGQVGHGMDKKASVFEEKDSAFCDMPPESDKKEKFKMVIGKSKKETQETESKGTLQEPGIMVDAAAAAAILQAATRGIKNSSLKSISSTNSSAHVHANSNEDGQPLWRCQADDAVEKSVQSACSTGAAVAPMTIAKTAAVEAPNEAVAAETHLAQERKLKSERLKRAKMFVAMLKSGELPFKTGTSRSSSLEPLESGALRSSGEVNLNDKERVGALAPADADRSATGEKPERNYFGEEHAERFSKRNYRSRSGGCVDEDDGDTKEHNEHCSRRDSRSRSRIHDDDDYEKENAAKMERQHRRRRHRHTHSSEEKDERETSDDERDLNHHKLKPRSHHSPHEDECDDKYKKDRNHKRHRKKHRHDTSHEHSRKRRSSKQHLLDEDEPDDSGRDKKRSRKKHHSHHSSHRSREKHGHRSVHSSGDLEPRANLKHETSSDDEHRNSSHIHEHRKGLCNERNGLEEGEISSRVSEETRGIASGHISREASVDRLSSHHMAPSQPSETTAEVPEDLKAKVRALLMATRV